MDCRWFNDPMTHAMIMQAVVNDVLGFVTTLALIAVASGIALVRQRRQKAAVELKPHRWVCGTCGERVRIEMDEVTK